MDSSPVIRSSPLVSVVVAVKNGAVYLAECLDSIVASTYRPLEIVVVDGGSTDGSPRIAGACPLARVVPQEGSGIAAAYNRGIAESRGDLVAFLSHDDRWTADKLELQVDLLRRQPELRCVVGRASFFLADPEAPPPPGFRAELLGTDRVAYIVETLLADRSLFAEIAFDTRFGTAEDVDWFARARDAGVAMGVVDRVVLHKRIHAGNASLGAGNNRDLLLALKGSVDRKRRG